MATIAAPVRLGAFVLQPSTVLGGERGPGMTLHSVNGASGNLPTSCESICGSRLFLNPRGVVQFSSCKSAFPRAATPPQGVTTSKGVLRQFVGTGMHSTRAGGSTLRGASNQAIGRNSRSSHICAARSAPMGRGQSAPGGFEKRPGDREAFYRGGRFQEQRGPRDPPDGESGYENQGRGFSGERGFQGGNGYDQRRGNSWGRGGRGGPGYQEGGRYNPRGDGEGGRSNAPGRRLGGFDQDRPPQSERSWDKPARPLQEPDDFSDDDVQTRSFEKGVPRSAPPPEQPPPFRRMLLKKELFEKQGKQLAGNLGLDERDVYGWKKDDLRDQDAYDTVKRPNFRSFAQRDIFKGRIGQPSAPPESENGVSTFSEDSEDFEDDEPSEIQSEPAGFRNRVREGRVGPRDFRNGVPGRVAPGDFRNEGVKPFVKPKLSGLDVGPTIDSIQPRFVPREEDILPPGWNPKQNRGYRPPRERRENEGGEDMAENLTPRQWLRKPPPPVSRYRPVASDGEIKFEEIKKGKLRRSGLEQEEDGFWDEEHDSGEISFARAAIRHDLQLEDLEEVQFQMQQEEKEEKQRRRRMLYRAETMIDQEELKRLRRNALQQRFFIKIGKTGVTNQVLNMIFKIWENLEVAKVKVKDGALIGQMRFLHDALEEKTGGLVILRTGTLVHLYRGPDYTGPPPRPKVHDITEAIGDQDLFGEDDDLEEADLMEQFEVEDGISSVAQFLLKDDAQEVPKLARKLAVMSGGEKGEVRKRLTEKPVRWLPPGQSAKLTNFEMMMLRRKGKRIKPAFVLGQQRRFDGLAAAIMEYWERNEIVKISCRAVINANLVNTSKAIQDLIGGVLLVKEGGLISLYRGKDYLPLRIGEALRRYQQRMIAEKELERAREAEGKEELDAGGKKEDSKWVAEAGVSEEELAAELEEDDKVARAQLDLAGEREALEVSDKTETVSNGVETVSDGAETISDAGGLDTLVKEEGAQSEGLPGAGPTGLGGFGQESASEAGLDSKMSGSESVQGEERRAESSLVQNTEKEGTSETAGEGDMALGVNADSEGSDAATLDSLKPDNATLSGQILDALRSDGVSSDAPTSDGIDSDALKSDDVDADALKPDGVDSVALKLDDADSDALKSDAADSDAELEPILGPDGKPLRLVKDLVVLENEVPQARVDQMLEAVAAYRRRDIETLTPEERAQLRKKGLGERRFLQVGRRGVFAGTIQNIHLHWKRHELCKVKCTGIRPEIVPIIAEQLAVESGGVLVDYVGTTILLYRGKNYIAPETIVPVHMLNKQEALRRAKAEQRAQSLLDLEIQRQEELAKQRKRLEYSLQLEKEKPAKKKDYPLAPGVREFVVIPEAVELNTTVEMELRKAGPLIPKEHNQPDLPAFWRAPDMSPVQKKKIANMSKQERTSAFLVGKRGITEGLGLTIRQHFYKHAFAKVSLKQRPNGITVKECMIELERLTGGVCVSKEPTRVILYRGWEPGTDPPWIKKDPETGEVVLPRRPLISKILRETEDGLDDSQTGGTNVFGEQDDFSRGEEGEWESEDEEGGGEEDRDSVAEDLDVSDSEEGLGDEGDVEGNGVLEKESVLPQVLYVDSNGVGHSSVEARV